jgi:hypothetical protein
MEDSELGNWLKFFVLFIFGLGTVVIFFLFFNRNSFLTKASGAQATLSFNPSSLTVKKDGILSTQVELEVNNAYVRGSDIKIVYDPSRLTLLKVRPLAQEQSSLKTYLPLDASKNFNEYAVIKRANSEGVIELSAVTFDVKNSQFTQTLTGKLALVELTFIAKKEGSANIAFLANNLTLDSTVVQDTNPPLNILTKTNLFMIQVESVTPTPTKKKEK